MGRAVAVGVTLPDPARTMQLIERDPSQLKKSGPRGFDRHLRVTGTCSGALSEF
jgi:hypothetical protein